MLYKVSNPDYIKRKISELQPLNYNRFFWWRRFDNPNKPLPQGASFLDRIKNKEFEYSHYYYQACYCEIEINAKYEEYNNDMQKLLENHKIDFERRKRLWEDFEKNENSLLEELKKNFLSHFIMSEKEYEDLVVNFEDTIEELYYYVRKTFDHSVKPRKKRGRPKKVVFLNKSY